MSKGFSGTYVRKVLNVQRNINPHSTPFWVVEFRGPDGLRYIATYFEPRKCAIICVAAPMRMMLSGSEEHGFESEIEFVLAGIIDAQAKFEAAKREARDNPEPPIVVDNP